MHSPATNLLPADAAPRRRPTGGAIVARQLFLWLPIAFYCAMWTPDAITGFHSQLRFALSLTLVAWGVLGVATAAEVARLKRKCGRPADRLAASFICGGFALCCLLLALPMWGIADASVHPAS